ncbi:FH protein interacting protein FIP2-like [Malus sylvestris]|uniref:FH protein interacting protein FIP2-like n=1 Tax=Malus sylvestris TaxID=3752 RepID=UPI0021ACE673|nr:FH protein interacting protein FIP2-like [Malus sylvestris]
MLAGMFSSQQTLRQDEKGYIFIDRDGEHFWHIQRSGIDTRLTSIIFKGLIFVALIFLKSICANLQRASFNHVDAEGAAFDNADLLESTFVGANLRGATFLGAKSKNYNLTASGASCVEDCKGLYEDLITAKT